MKSWADLVDGGVSADESIMLRYSRVLDLLRLDLQVGLEDLERARIAEGARVFHLETYRGVEILVADESSLMATGTYKDLDACLVNAIAGRVGLDKMVLSSGGNLGCAMATYARKSGHQVYLFHPHSTLHKLVVSDIDWSSTKLISVDLPEPDVKRLARLFARKFSILHIPDIRWRLAASAVRTLFILEAIAEQGKIDYLAQVMCAGYGPAGIYNCFSELLREGLVASRSIPHFLGFQQEANAPMVRAWRENAREISRDHVAPNPNRYLEPGLYNTNPGRNYTRLYDLMRSFGGTLAPISSEDYDRYVPVLLDWFRRAGAEFAVVPDTGEILEKTGLLTGVGLLAAVDRGLLKQGERVLYLLTGGARKTRQSRSGIDPDVQVDSDRSLEEWVEQLGETFGLRAVQNRRAIDHLFS